VDLGLPASTGKPSIVSESSHSRDIKGRVDRERRGGGCQTTTKHSPLEGVCGWAWAGGREEEKREREGGEGPFAMRTKTTIG